MQGKPTSRALGADIFWAEMSPCDHVVQIYADDTVFLDALEGFVAGGLRTGECVILIATPPHLRGLEERLGEYGVDVATVAARDQYITLDANEALAEFMVNGWPDDAMFEKFINNLLARARRSGTRVRAFGEMVALLWARGDNAATIRLEHLWHALCHEQSFPLFCAYPRSGFTQDATASISEICAAHSRVVAA